MSEQNSTTTETTEQFHEVTPSDYQRLFEEQVAETEKLRTILAASRISAVADNQKDSRAPSITAQRLTAMLGQHQLNQMSKADKIRALGLDPSTVNEDLLRACWGRGNDGAALSELHRTNPRRMRELREAAILLGMYAN